MRPSHEQMHHIPLRSLFGGKGVTVAHRVVVVCYSYIWYVPLSMGFIVQLPAIYQSNCGEYPRPCKPQIHWEAINDWLYPKVCCFCFSANFYYCLFYNIYESIVTITSWLTLLNQTQWIGQPQPRNVSGKPPKRSCQRRSLGRSDHTALGDEFGLKLPMKHPLALKTSLWLFTAHCWLCFFHSGSCVSVAFVPTWKATVAYCFRLRLVAHVCGTLQFSHHKKIYKKALHLLLHKWP